MEGEFDSLRMTRSGPRSHHLFRTLKATDLRLRLRVGVHRGILDLTAVRSAEAIS